MKKTNNYLIKTKNINKIKIFNNNEFLFIKTTYFIKYFNYFLVSQIFNLIKKIYKIVIYNIF